MNGMNIAAPNLMVVCYDEKNEMGGSGRLYCCYKEGPIVFGNEYQLLMNMESIMEKINYPQSSVIIRNYKEKKREEKEELKKVVEQREIVENRGKKATFVVYVKYRQNATWQGELLWVEQDTVRTFRSVLEMLKLMDNAQLD